MSSINYLYLVDELLKRNKYCLLKEKVTLTIFYKRIKPKSNGIYIRSDEQIDEVYTNNIEALNYTFLSQNSGSTYLHKEKEINLEESAAGPVQCVSIKIFRNVVNRHLGKQFKFFEEEIQYIISCLNKEPPKIAFFLGIGFIESTQWLPITVQLFVHNYKMEDIDSCHFDISEKENKKIFGPDEIEEEEEEDSSEESKLFTLREVEASLSKATSKLKILSLRDSSQFKRLPHKPNWTIEVNPYIIHYVVDKQAYIPLAFNPYENPIIC